MGSFDQQLASSSFVLSADSAMGLYDEHGREAYALAVLLQGDRDSAEVLLLGIFDDPGLGASLAMTVDRHGTRVALLLEVLRAHRNLA